MSTASERYRRHYLRVKDLPYSRFCRDAMHWACHGLRGQKGPKQPCECACHKSDKAA